VDIKSFGKEIELIGNFDGVNVRKIKIQKDCNVQYDLLYDFQVENIGTGRFYGFSVDRNERYVLQNFIVTYNSNGKTIFTKLIKNAFGNYYDILEHTVLTRQRGNASNATPELADKQGKRFIIMQEPEEEDRIHVGFMKQISGGDQITARALFKNTHKYNPQFKIAMVCNNLPDIQAQDEGTWRRIIVIEFKSEFVDYKPEKENQFKKDKEIENKMLQWHSVFMWMLLKEYYPMYKKEGLEPPDDVKIKTSKFRNENDSINEFIHLTYDITKKSTDKIQFTVFCSSFRNWFREAHGNKCPETKVIRNYIEKSSYYSLDGEGHITGLKDKATDDIDQDI
jgi:P4 family phage/plasmid primase-like protien